MPAARKSCSPAARRLFAGWSSCNSLRGCGRLVGKRVVPDTSHAPSPARSFLLERPCEEVAVALMLVSAHPPLALDLRSETRSLHPSTLMKVCKSGGRKMVDVRGGRG